MSCPSLCIPAYNQCILVYTCKYGNETLSSLGIENEPTISDVTGERHGRLVGPAPCHVPDGVAAAPQQEHGEVVAPHEVHTLRVTWGSGWAGHRGCN